MEEMHKELDKAIPVHTKRQNYYAVVDAEKFASNPFGQCYLADDGDRLVYKGNMNAWGNVILEVALARAREAEQMTGRPHKAVCFEIVKNVWEACDVE